MGNVSNETLVPSHASTWPLNNSPRWTFSTCPTSASYTPAHFGAFGRLWLGGYEAEIAAAADAIKHVLEGISGRENKVSAG